MSQHQHSPASHKPDSRVFASYPMPPKIDLINERPRRESQVERELDGSIASGSGPFLASIPEIKVSQQHEDPIVYNSTQNKLQQNTGGFTKTTTMTTNTSERDQSSTDRLDQRSNSSSRTADRRSPQYKVSGVEFGFRSSPQPSPQAVAPNFATVNNNNTARETETQQTQVIRTHHQSSPQPAQYGCHEHRIIISVGPICSRPGSSCSGSNVQLIDNKTNQLQTTTTDQRRREEQRMQQEQLDREEWLRAQQTLKEEQENLERQTRLEQQQLELERQRRQRIEQERRDEEERRRKVEQERLVEQQRQRQLLQAQQQQTTTTTRTTITRTTNSETLANELAAKEAKLRADINALHDRPYSPFQVPNKVDLTNEQRIAQQQQGHSPSPRPYSRTSSTRSATTAADLLMKEEQLQREIEEIEKKPFNPQTMVVEREQWFEYPEDRPHDKQLTESKRRIKDFCSQPSHMYPSEGRHIHEENIPAPSSSANRLSADASLHTAIIKGPKREVDNKSPLPFAFDNFSTKGVRGNIASACAIEPDRPRPPIYPIVKKSPSPASLKRGL